MAAPPTPAAELDAPRGRRVTVIPRSPDDRLGDLADALGLDPHRPLCLDGRSVGRHETLARAGLVQGSRLEPLPSPAPPAAAEDVVVTVVGEAGPGAGTAIRLGAGRHVVGRSPNVAVSIDDDTLEPHHALLDVDRDGAVLLTQLTGRVPCRVSGEPVDGPTAVPDGAPVSLGASRIRVGRADTPGPGSAVVTPAAGDPWRRTVQRTPRAHPRWEPVPIAVPPPGGPSLRPGGAGLMAAGFTLGGSVVVALVLRSPMFLVLGAVGVFASLGMWVVGRIGAVRDGRRAGAGRERERAAFAGAVEAQRVSRWRYHLAVTPPLAEAVAAATTIRADLWSRRADHFDAFVVSIGWGPVSWQLVLEEGPGDRGVAPELLRVIDAAERFDDAPVPAELGPGAALAVAGPRARAVVRAVIVQLATRVGPADWRLVVVVDDPSAWDWCRWLPHAAGDLVVGADDGERVTAVLTSLDDGDERHVVVVTDRPDLLALRTGALRRFLGAAPSVAIVVEVPAGEAVPALCRSVLELGSIGLARWWPDASIAARCDVVHAAGVPAATAAAVARTLAGLRDPEDPAAAASALATSVSLAELCEHHGVGSVDDPIAIAAAWRSAGPDPAPTAPIGLTGDGVVEIDLARDGPHALIAGTTGSGKSELLRTLVVSLAARCSPDHLTFVLVDYKGGATFDACADLPHTVGVVTDLDDRLAERALVSLDAEIRRRERLLRSAGAADLTDYRAATGRPALPRLAVIIDEFAALAAELPGFLAALVGIAQRGRSLGIHLVLATQRPAGVVSDDIRANTNLRVALRLQDPGDARDVVGDEGPVSFPRGTPGRAMLRLGPTETVVFQSARSTGPPSPRRDERLRVVDGDAAPVSEEATDLAVLVRSIRHAAALSDIVPPHRPWLPPLPDRVEPDSGAVGLVDVPAEQRQEPLRWAPADGNLALVGALGSGTTTALTTVVVAACAGRQAHELHVYVIDARGDEGLGALTALDHCGGVVRPHERERLRRLLRRLTAELDRRRANGGRADDPEIVVAIDGLPALRATLDGPADTTDYEHLARVLTEGPAVGIAAVVTAERPGAIPPAMLAACAERWLFHLDDPAEASAGGVPAALVPGAVPGRVVVASSRLAAQVAVAPAVAPGGRRSAAGGPSPIGVLPAHVAASEVPPGALAGEHEVGLVAGLDFETLGPARLTVPDGEHVLVAGPARSGRTTGLVRLARSWRQAHPAGTVRVVCPLRRSALATWPETVEAADAIASVARVPAGRPCLLVIDDAERLDDPADALAGLIAERRPGLLVMAAGRPDALRTLYGHWTTIVRRSRLGLLMSMCSDIDGDVLGELLPRYPPLAPRPGLAWLVGGGHRTLAQIALDE